MKVLPQTASTSHLFTSARNLPIVSLEETVVAERVVIGGVAIVQDALRIGDRQQKHVWIDSGLPRVELALQHLSLVEWDMVNVKR